MASPFSTCNTQLPGNSSGPYTGFCNCSTPPVNPTLFNISISRMRYDNNTVLNDVMENISRKISACQYSSFYKVPYRTILNVTTVLEPTQERQVTPLVENDNQQQIYRWVRKYLLLLLCRVYYTDWELRQSVEGIILLNSSCTATHEKFGVPNISIQNYLNIIFPPLKYSLLNHL